MGSCGCRGDPAIFMEASTVQVTERDYERLSNLPSINGTTLVGALTLAELGMTAEGLGVAEMASESVEQAMAALDLDDQEVTEVINV